MIMDMKLCQETEILQFDNPGVLVKKLPITLFQKLKEECLYIESIRKNGITDEMYNYTTGIESNNQPFHYALKNTKTTLQKYISNLIYEYQNKFPTYIKSIQILSCDVPFFVDSPWVNIQSKGEYLPLHSHTGVYSYTIWVKIPFRYESENTRSTYEFDPVISSFQFVYTNCLGSLEDCVIPLTPEYEGCLLFFPSKLKHVVNPFFTSNDYRISISGNVLLNTTKHFEVK